MPPVAMPETSSLVSSSPLEAFLRSHPTTQYIQFQWVDYTGMRRMRLVPVATAQKLEESKNRLAISKAVFSLCQNDFRTVDINVVGQWVLTPAWAGLRSFSNTQASLMCTFNGDKGSPDEVEVCPRYALEKAIRHAQTTECIDVTIGFETEFVLLTLDTFEQIKGTHAWSSAVPLNPRVMACIEDIMTSLQKAGLEVLYMHAEACPGQFEIITGPLPALEAVDAVYFTRQTIQAVSYQHGFRATLHPLPFPDQAGTAAHTHISVKKSGDNSPSALSIDKPFFAGVLKHIEGLMALTMASPVSFQRVRDMCWAGGTWKCWGDHNRETPLRRSNERDRHWEIRCVDATSNLYIALAGVIYAGLDGIKKDMRLPEPCEVDPATLSVNDRVDRGITDRLPQTLPEGLSALLSDEILVAGLGDAVVQNFKAIKDAEMKLFDSMDSNKVWRLMTEVY